MAYPTSNQRYVSGQGRSTVRTYDAARYPTKNNTHRDAGSHAVRPRPAQQSPPGAAANKAAQPAPRKQSNQSTEPSATALVAVKDVLPPKQPEGLAKQKPKPKRSQVLNRKLVNKPFGSSNKDELLSNVAAAKRATRKPVFRLKKITTSAVALLLVVGLGGFSIFALNNYYDNQNTEVPPEVLSESVSRASSTQTHQQAIVDETPVSRDDIHNNSVPHNYPKRISIDSVDIEARIKAAGVNRRQQLVFPDNIYDVHWYEGSRVPGQRGAILLSGYVSGPTERGSFYYTRALEHGDIITIETGDGTRYQYEIKYRELKPYDKVDIFDLLVPHEPEGNWLHLVAIDDRYNVMTEGFQDRLIIYAQQK